MKRMGVRRVKVYDWVSWDHVYQETKASLKLRANVRNQSQLRSFLLRPDAESILAGHPNLSENVIAKLYRIAYLERA